MNYKLIHFYNNPNFLFKTVTMYPEKDRNTVYDSIVSSKSWYSGRYTKSENKFYMKQRIAVEEMLYNDFRKKYWTLEEKIPVYFSILPKFSYSKINTDLEKRIKAEENKAKVFITHLENIQNYENISFTINDSFIAYRQRLIEKDIPVCSVSKVSKELDEYGEIFHISELKLLHKKYKNSNILFEVQIWDKKVISSLSNENS